MTNANNDFTFWKMTKRHSPT